MKNDDDQQMEKGNGGEQKEQPWFRIEGDRIRVAPGEYDGADVRMLLDAVQAAQN